MLWRGGENSSSSKERKNHLSNKGVLILWRTWGMSGARPRTEGTCVDRRRGENGEGPVEERWREAGLLTVALGRRGGRPGSVEGGEVLHGGRVQGHGISAGFPTALPYFSTPHPQLKAEPRVAEPPSSARPERRLTGGSHSTRFWGPRKRAKRLRRLEKRQL